jgi:anti-sigma factor RsiW
MSDHTRYKDDVGAYLLGALTELERQAFERHLRGCDECQEELERLRPAADALPGSVEQVQPPPRLKASLMEVVEREAQAEQQATAGARTDGAGRRRFGGPAGRRRFASPAGRRRFLRPAFVAAGLLIGLVIGFAVAQLGGEETRTVAATVDKAMPRAGGTLRIAGDEATLRLHDMPDLGNARVYQVWLQHGDRLVPARTFVVGRNGAGRVDLPDVHNADGVYVTREPRGGAQVPSEDPIVSVPL